MDDRGDEDPRCGWPKKDGTPCRNRVPDPGKVCRVHQKAALLDRLLAGRASENGENGEAAPAGGPSDATDTERA